jgi:GTP pyrophosphokinase
MRNIREKERLVEVEWGHTERLYPVSVRVEAWDRVGLLRDISTVVAEEKVNIATVGTTEHDDHTASILLTLETKGIRQLSLLLDRIEGIRGVISVTRSSDGVQPR